MAIIVRGRRDKIVGDIKRALDLYQGQYPTAQVELYRQNSGSVRIRIVDERFRGWSRGRRHDHVWNFLAKHLDDDTIQEISILLLLTQSEQTDSLMNLEFNDPIPSNKTWT